MFNRILILRGVIEIGNSDVGRFVVKKNMMVIDYYTILSMISSEILIYTFQNFSQFNFLISTSQFTMSWQIFFFLNNSRANKLDLKFFFSISIFLPDY